MKKILSNYSMYSFNGETNGKNNGKFVEHRKTIKIEMNSKTKFHNIIVTDTITKTKVIEGNKKMVEKLEEIENLKYQNGKYQIQQSY